MQLLINQHPGPHGGLPCHRHRYADGEPEIPVYRVRHGLVVGQDHAHQERQRLLVAVLVWLTGLAAGLGLPDSLGQHPVSISTSGIEPADGHSQPAGLPVFGQQLGGGGVVPGSSDDDLHGQFLGQFAVGSGHGVHVEPGTGGHRLIGRSKCGMGGDRRAVTGDDLREVLACRHGLSLGQVGVHIGHLVVGDEDLVGLPSSGHRHVEALAVHRRRRDRERRVHGDALGPVDRGGVTQFHILGDVLGRQDHCVAGPLRARGARRVRGHRQ